MQSEILILNTTRIRSKRIKAISYGFKNYLNFNGCGIKRETTEVW